MTLPTHVGFSVLVMLAGSGPCQDASTRPPPVQKEAPMQVPHQLNRLAGETSPYLRQHAGNPVDWYPWGPEALARARDEDKPIFLSIGYSACHWCHVMERESFENSEIADLMNGTFINIKVDREERPDIDAIYMSAVQVMTGGGGWPLSVFLTPDLQPFWGGTYFPPEDRQGRPGFASVLRGIARAWSEQRHQIEKSAADLTGALSEIGMHHPAERLPERELLMRFSRELAQSFDRRNGGFGAAPKFPRATDLRLLIRVAFETGDEKALEMVRTTLTKMAEGGLYDQLGGGFHRYSTDAQWLVPHFEKMLYDNALIVQAYLDACLIEPDPRYVAVVRGTLDFVLREMTDPDGGFYSTLDADSEGEEGKFYVWDRAEIEQILGSQDAELFCGAYGVTEGGNFEAGQSILHVTASPAALAANRSSEGGGETPEEIAEILARCRAELFEKRSGRIRPHLDDKVLASWNGLMIGAMARAGVVLGEPRYVGAARRAAEFITRHLTEEGRLLRSWSPRLRDRPAGAAGGGHREAAASGHRRPAAYLDDYAFLSDGLLDLYEATFEPRWVTEARRLTGVLLERFWDDRHGGFFFTADDHEKLIVRRKDSYDGALPAGDAVAACEMVRLFELTGENRFLEKAEGTVRAAAGGMEASPQAFAQMLSALDRLTARRRSLVICGAQDAEATMALIDTMRHHYLPNTTMAWGPAAGPDATLREAIPLLEGRTASGGAAAAFVCEGFSCRAPVHDPEALLALLELR